MKLVQLQLKQTGSMPNDKLTIAYRRLHHLLSVAETKSHSDTLIDKINLKIQMLNSSNKMNTALYRLVNLTENEIINLLEQDLKIVPKGHYTKKWQALGIATFGIPIGVAIGLLSKNMGFLGIGLPLGVGIGALIGKRKDAEAAAQGRQYDLAG